MIDTHIHLYDSSFDPDFADVVGRAKSSGVVKCVMPGIDSSYHQKMLTRAEELKGFAYPTIGLHPTSVAENWREELKFVKENIDLYPFCAVGEIGIDGYWSKEFIAEQKKVFREEILLAVERNLPIIVHAREGHNEIFEVLRSLKKEGLAMKGVFHAFSSSIEIYREIKKYGDFKVGIGGVLTYKNASIALTLKEIPLEDIVLETDAPWLTPAPHRGKRNESSYLCIISDKIAEIKGCEVERVIQMTTKNANELFNLK